MLTVWLAAECVTLLVEMRIKEQKPDRSDGAKRHVWMILRMKMDQVADEVTQASLKYQNAWLLLTGQLNWAYGSTDHLIDLRHV